jgi:hypothetical protein
LQLGCRGRRQLDDPQIDAKSFEQVFIHVWQLLDMIQHPDLLGGHSKVPSQIKVSVLNDRGNDGGSEIDRNPVRFAVTESSKDTLP